MKIRIFKKNRMVSILLALCMVLALLPTTTLADGLPEPQNYEEFKQRAGSSSGIDLTEYPGYTIPWPEEGDTLTIGGIICLRDDLEIPENITVRTSNGGCFSAPSANGQPIARPTVTIHGDVFLGPTDHRQPFDCNVTVASGSSIKNAESQNVSMRVGKGWTLTMEEGASIDVHTVRLDGTLTGAGTVNSRISVLDTTSSGGAHAVLSGSLTLTGWVRIGESSSSQSYDTLTIPTGSDIKFTDGGYLDITNYGTVCLEGKLELLGEDAEKPEEGGRVRFSDDAGILNMADGSMITVQYPSSISGVWNANPLSPYITGSGTIELYKNNDNQPHIFYKYPDDIDRDPQLYDKYIETAVTVKRTWVCDEHKWGDWATDTEATCGTSGEKKRACSVCGKMEFQYIAPTGEHSWNTSTWVSDSTSHWHVCANCEETTDAAAHTFGDWTVTQEATAAAAGSQYRDCAVCGYREVQAIPAVGGGDSPDVPTPPPVVTPGVSNVSSITSNPGTPSDSSSTTTTEPASKPEETPETPKETRQPETPAAPETPSLSVPAYADVAPAAWYNEAASYVSARGLMTGTSAAEFSPAANMTRAMVWTVLGRLDGADVSGSGAAWYDSAQAWSKSKGISDGSNPNGSVTREELVTMLWRYMDSPAASADLGRFGDSASVSGWAYDAVQWAVSAGLLEGSGGNLNPNGTATRAEVAAILMRFCENVIK